MLLSSKELPWPRNIVMMIVSILHSFLVMYLVADYIRRHKP